MPVSWYGKSFTDQVKKGSMALLVEAGDVLRDEIRMVLSTPGKVYAQVTSKTGKVRKKLVGRGRSRPGEPPRKQTGRLLRSAYRRINRKRLSVRVGARGSLMQYGTKFVKPRPWLSLAMKKAELRMKLILARKVA